jgi:histidine ammonia-lyase
MAAVKHFTVGGIGAQPGVDDVARVAHGLQIELDTAGAERIKKESPPPKSFQAEAPAADLPAATSNLLTPTQARAFLVTRLMSLMAGKSGVRLQVAEFLRDLLNASQQQALPAIPAAGGEPAASATLIAACHGLGASAGGQPLAEALAAAGLTPPGLSTAEREVLSSGAAATAGVGSLAIVSGRQAVAAATAVAALSFEAFGAQVRHLPL